MGIGKIERQFLAVCETLISEGVSPERLVKALVNVMYYIYQTWGAK